MKKNQQKIGISLNIQRGKRVIKLNKIREVR